MPDIELLTNQVFDLSQPLLSLINEELAQNENVPGTTDLGLLEVERERQNSALFKKTKDFFQTELNRIYPQAGIWFKHSSKPEQEYLWVVSPFVFNLMGHTFSSVALQQEDTHLLGVYFDWKELKIVTGEKGGGANIFEKTLRVSSRELNENSNYVQYVPSISAGGLHKEKAMAFLIRTKKLFEDFRSPIKTRHAVNSIMENVPGAMIQIASGTMDFTYAAHFDYPDVAACVAIVEEAGGLCTDFSGGKDKLYLGEELFCSNKLIHTEFLQKAKKHL